MPDGHAVKASQQVLLPNITLKQEAQKANELLGLRSSLISVTILANHGYTTVLRSGQEGVEVYHSANVEILTKGKPVFQGWCD